MRNFRQIACRLGVGGLLEALEAAPDLWDQFPIRTQEPDGANADVSDILVFFHHSDDSPIIPYPAWHRLPQLRPLIFDLMRVVEGVELGRVVIAKLAPGKTIRPHVDGGVEGFSRYQIALQSDAGCLFRAGDETAEFREGEAWWFRNDLEHEVVNGSDADRIVVIVDIRRA